MRACRRFVEPGWYLLPPSGVLGNHQTVQKIFAAADKLVGACVPPLPASRFPTHALLLSAARGCSHGRSTQVVASKCANCLEELFAAEGSTGLREAVVDLIGTKRQVGGSARATPHVVTVPVALAAVSTAAVATAERSGSGSGTPLFD